MAWTSLLLDCPVIPEFPVVPPGGELRARGEEFAACMKKKGIDEETIKAMNAIAGNFPLKALLGCIDLHLCKSICPSSSQPTLGTKPKAAWIGTSRRLWNSRGRLNLVPCTSVRLSPHVQQDHLENSQGRAKSEEDESEL